VKKKSRLCARWPEQRARLTQLRNQWQAEELLFGKPEWFAKKKRSWGISPTQWQGWVYAAVWTLVIALPFLMLLGRHRAPEAAVWLAGSLGMLVWDVRKLARTLAHRRQWSLGENDQPESATASAVNS